MSFITSKPADKPATPSALQVTRNDRLANILVFMIAVSALIAGLLAKQQYLNQQWYYTSRQFGVEAAYPAGWLTNEDSGFVVQISDPRARPFKTEFRITVVPAGGATSIRNVLDTLTLQRASDLPAYSVLDIEELEQNGMEFTQMNFVFVDADPNPYIQSLPKVVIGRDIVIRDGERAIIITFMAHEAAFDAELPRFERFLSSVRY